MNKRAIIPIISMILLITVTILAIISLQTWFSNFNSNIIMKVENQNTRDSVEIEGLIGTTLYLKNFNSENVTINSIIISNKTCSINSQNISSGLQEIDINDCIDGIRDTIKEVTVISDEGVYTKSLYLNEEISNSNVESNLNNIVDNFSLGNLNNIQIYNNNLILEYNSSNYYKTGNYTSKIYDAGNLANWSNFNIEYNLSNKFISSKIKNNLIAYYSFNENANDNTENGFDGIVNFATQISEGKLGNAYSFNGNNNYINIGNNLTTNLNLGFTLSAWVKWGGNLKADEEVVIGRWSNSIEDNKMYLLRWDSETSSFEFYVNNGYEDISISGTSDTDISDKNWHQIIAIFNQSAIFLYFDGQKSLSSQLVDGTLRSHKTETNLGSDSRDGYPTDYFNGILDELGIWNKSLTDEEVTELYNSGNGLNYLEPTNLTLQIRTSNNNIVWSEWTDKSLSTTNIVDSARYFQFRFLFETTDITSTPILNKISFDYELN